MKILVGFLLILMTSLKVTAQNDMIVLFKDKGNQTTKNLELQFSSRSLERRKQNHVSFDSRDIPVEKSYINQLSNVAIVGHSSRWMNAVRINSALSPESLKNQFSFIREVIWLNENETGKINKNLTIQNEQKSVNYGLPDTQARQLNLQCLHDDGFTGNGVYLAVIDAGFNGMDTISFFQNVYSENRVKDVYDFVGGGSVYNYSGHGTAVSSCIVGEKNGTQQYIGTAVDVELALYVTEDISSETQAEEYNLVLALERCDSVGVQVANISLGYTQFDDSLTSYEYSDMDGNTTISAVGAKVAASKGIAVVSSAGNGGPGKISTPCDADSILCIGAIEGFGNWAWFSSVGPSFDGRVKPDVAARGGQAWVVFQDGSVGQGNGTSFSSPVMAGAVACLIEAKPYSTAQETIEAVRQSAHQAQQPDTLLGYGIPNFCTVRSLLFSPELTEITIHPNPTNGQMTIQFDGDAHGVFELTIYDAMGRVIRSEEIQNKTGEVIYDITNVKSGMYLLRLTDSSGNEKFKHRLIKAG